MFENYPEERLHIASITSRLDLMERKFRSILMERIIDAGRPIEARDLLQVSGFDIACVEALCNRMAAKRVIVRNHDGMVEFVYPVSALPTHHQVKLADGRSFYAMCAVDALGAAFTFGQDTTVSSKCSACGVPVSIEVTSEKVIAFEPPYLKVLHADLKQANNWAGSC